MEAGSAAARGREKEAESSVTSDNRLEEPTVREPKHACRKVRARARRSRNPGANERRTQRT